MKTRIFLVAMALIVFASLSFGQGFCRQLYNYDETNPVGLHVQCDPASPLIPDGAEVWIYWDSNSNGPDATDPLASACPAPCTVNYDHLFFNGEAAGVGPGFFFSDLDFCSAGCLPTPARFFFVIYCPGTTTWEYVTGIHTYVATPDVDLITDWTCTPCVTPPSCIVDPAVSLIPNAPLPGPQTATVCVHNDGTAGTVVTVPVVNASNVPTVSVTPGCPEDPNCIPGVPGSFTAWVFNPAPPSFTSTYTGIVGGGCCVTLHLDFILAATISSFTGVAGDNSVTLTWVASSEANLARYDVVRNGDVVGHVDATNPNGATYTFVDKNVHNGTTYNYVLRMVDMNNSTSDFGTHVSATPSFNAAVITEYALHQNFPNPFNPTTEIAFDVLNENPVTLKVYNAAGQVVATLLSGVTEPNGRHIVNFDATNLTSGLYFYTVKIGNEFSATKKMMLLK